MSARGGGRANYTKLSQAIQHVRSWTLFGKLHADDTKRVYYYILQHIRDRLLKRHCNHRYHVIRGEVVSMAAAHFQIQRSSRVTSST